MLCVKCGKSMSKAAKFCGGCGNKIEVSSPSSDSSIGGLPKPKNNTIIAGVVGFLAALIIGVGAFLLWNSMSDDVSGGDLSSPSYAVAPEYSEQILEPQPEIGSIMSFGGHNWRVLDVQGGRALIITERIIDFRAYHERREAVTWEVSTIRHYLNNQFFNNFNTTDRARIAETRIANNNNLWFGTHGGNDTNDRIFLLSIEEVIRYFGDSGYLWNRPDTMLWIDDRYNIARIANDAGGNISWWWLRSPGYNSSGAASIDSGGRVGINGGHLRALTDDGGIRPALWLNL